MLCAGELFLRFGEAGLCGLEHVQCLTLFAGLGGKRALRGGEPCLRVECLRTARPILLQGLVVARLCGLDTERGGAHLIVGGGHVALRMAHGSGGGLRLVGELI